MEYPVTRLRRLRVERADALSGTRNPSRTQSSFIYPFFIRPGEGVRNEISSMPGVFNLSVDEALKEAEAAATLGIGGLLLFGCRD